MTIFSSKNIWKKHLQQSHFLAYEAHSYPKLTLYLLCFVYNENVFSLFVSLLRLWPLLTSKFRSISTVLISLLKKDFYHRRFFAPYFPSSQRPSSFFPLDRVVQCYTILVHLLSVIPFRGHTKVTVSFLCYQL